MNYIKIIRKNRLTFYAVLITLVFALSFFYYTVYRLRRSTTIYVYGSIVKNLNFPNTGVFWTPNWIEQAINERDRDYTPFGNVNAEVISKEAIPDKSNGSQVNLILKINSIQDRTGQFLYKNKPLTVGSVINLTLPRANINFMITNIDKHKPNELYRTITVSALSKDLDPWQTEALKVGSIVKSSKGNTLIKITKKQEDFARINATNEFGQETEVINRQKKDLIATLELLVSEKDGNYSFFGTQQIRPGAILYVPWESAEMNFTITEVNR